MTGPEPESRDVSVVLGGGSDCDVATNPIINCGFESGDFLDITGGWETEDLQVPFFPLVVDHPA